MSIPKFVILAATNKFAPTGGVRNPTSHAITIIIPNAIGWTPKLCTKGNNKKTVMSVINNYSENELANILYKFGEEKFSRKIAKKIINARKIKDIESTKELSLLIKQSYKNKSKIDPATRTFQEIEV